MMQPMTQSAAPVPLSSQLMTPVGGLATVGTAAAIGSYIFTTKKFNELSGHIEECNKQISQLTQFVQKIDPKTIPKLQHHMHELSHGISEMSTFVTGLNSTIEAMKAEHVALRADVQQLYEHLASSSGEAPPLPIPMAVAEPAPMHLKRRVPARPGTALPQVQPVKPSSAPQPLPTFGAPKRPAPAPIARVQELPIEADAESDDVDDIAARAAGVR